MGENKKNRGKKSEDQLSKTILTIDCKNCIKMLQEYDEEYREDIIKI